MENLGEEDGGDVAVGDGLSIVSSRPMGVAWLLDGLRHQLGTVFTAFVTDVFSRRIAG